MGANHPHVINLIDYYQQQVYPALVFEIINLV